MESSLLALLNWLSLPSVGLISIGVLSFFSATLLPLSSEPALLGYLKLVPNEFWWPVLAASCGNTLGGYTTWYLGRGSRHLQDKLSKNQSIRMNKLTQLLQKYGPKTLLFSWIPIFGDPLCALAGWAKFPWAQSFIYMAVGKFLRYALISIAFLTIDDSFCLSIGHLFSFK